MAADKAMNAADDELVANVGLEPNELLDPATGAIDYARASWKRASWKTVDDPLAWTRASWRCVCDEMTGGVLPTRASWKQATWSSFLGETPTSPVPTGKGSKSR